MAAKQGVLLILSGPTCAGKDAVMNKLLTKPNLTRLVTTNSRPKRPGEKEAVDYYFVSQEEFEKLISQGAFFEWVEYRGAYRGTRKNHVLEALNSGRDVIWRIDVRGVKNIRQKIKDSVKKSVFVMLISPLNVLATRAKQRQTENNEWQKWSLDMAKWEMEQKEDFDYLVENTEGKLAETVQKIEAIIRLTRNA